LSQTLDQVGSAGEPSSFVVVGGDLDDSERDDDPDSRRLSELTEAYAVVMTQIRLRFDGRSTKVIKVTVT